MGREGWGIYDNPEGGLTFLIPIIFEIENTSKRARIMRDVNLVLMKENKGIAGIFPDKSSPCRVTLIIFLPATTVSLHWFAQIGIALQDIGKGLEFIRIHFRKVNFEKLTVHNHLRLGRVICFLLHFLKSTNV